MTINSEAPTSIKAKEKLEAVKCALKIVKVSYVVVVFIGYLLQRFTIAPALTCYNTTNVLMGSHSTLSQTPHLILVSVSLVSLDDKASKESMYRKSSN